MLIIDLKCTFTVDSMRWKAISPCWQKTYSSRCNLTSVVCPVPTERTQQVFHRWEANLGWCLASSLSLKETNLICNWVSGPKSKVLQYVSQSKEMMPPEGWLEQCFGEKTPYWWADQLITWGRAPACSSEWLQQATEENTAQLGFVKLLVHKPDIPSITK